MAFKLLRLKNKLLFGHPFIVGFVYHTLLIFMLFGVIAICILSRKTTTTIFVLGLLAYLPILYIDFPVSYFIFVKYHLNSWLCFALLCSIGGVMWGGIFAAVATIGRYLRRVLARRQVSNIDNDKSVDR